MVVPDKDFWLQITYDTMSKGEMTASITHVIHFQSTAKFMETIKDCLQSQLGDESFCVHKLALYNFDIL